MRSVRAWLQRLLGVFGGDRPDRELADELASHLSMHIDDNLRAGMTPSEARRQAILVLGGVDQTKENYRDRRGLPIVETVLRDLRIGCRRLLRRPVAAFAIVVTLAASIGLNTSVFAIADAMILRPFPFPQVENLVYVDEARPDGPDRGVTSAANFLEWKRRTHSFSRLSGFALRAVELGSAGGGEPENLRAAAVTADFFEVLGTAPDLGRGFVADEETFGRHRSVVLGQALWMRRFAGDETIVGRSIVLDGVRHQVVGIAPRNFDFPFGTDLWVPLAFDAPTIAARGRRFVLGIGRLAPGTTIEAARAALAAVGRELSRAHPIFNTDRDPRVRPFAAGFVEDGIGQLFGFLQACALLVLLIACANVTNLLLAFGIERQREIAVRFALGATRSQILRGLWLENAVLGVVSAPLALGVAAAGLIITRATMPARFETLPGWRTIDLDARLMLFALALALLATLIVSLLSTIQMTCRNPDALKDAARGLTAGAGRQRLRRALIVAQVMLALPLLVAATSTWRGTSRFLNGPQGYEPQGLLTLRLALPERQYADPGARERFASAVLDGLAGLSDVRAAAIADVLPSTLAENHRQVTIEGQAPMPPNGQNPVDLLLVTPRYFETMRIRLLRGRGFTDGDRGNAEPVAIVSQSMADRYWPGSDPVGSHIRYPAGSHESPGRWITVVGVADEVIHDWMFARYTPTVYRPYAQDPSRNLALAIRTPGDPAAAAPEIRRVIHALDPDRPIFDVRSMEQVLRERLTGPRLVSAMMVTLSGLAVVLAALGLYGVIAYLVSQRTHEIALRVVLGARELDVLRLVVGHSFRLTAAGVILGTLLALATAPILGSMLFGIASFDLGVTIGLSLGVAATGLVAAYLPARRALRIEPMVALRSE